MTTIKSILLVCTLGALGALAPGAAAQGGLNQLPDPPTQRVSSAVELDQLLRREPPFQGRIVIPRDAQWDMTNRCGARDEFGRCVPTPLTCLPVRSGVQIVGERGALGSRPLLFSHHELEVSKLFEIRGDDVRIEGLHLRGPGSSRVSGHWGIFVGPRAENRQAPCSGNEDPAPLASRVQIVDNELERFNIAVELSGHVQVDDPADYPSGRRLSPQKAFGLVRVERNYIHHNRPKGNGYGVVVSGDAFGTIEGNVFEYNVHSVAASGRANSGYVARFNFLLAGALKYGCCYGHHFDVHGTRTASHAGGPAGTRFEITSNTVRGDQDPSSFEPPRAAFGLRGRPTQGALFAHNVLDHDEDAAVKLRAGGDAGLNEAKPATFGLVRNPNQYNVGHAAELATGDFDGDGRSDVFTSNGTAWFFSRAAVRPWEFMRPSNKLIDDLGFADVDNDGRTDVLYRDAGGKLSYASGGTAAGLTPLPSPPVPVPIRELRFGDFDGDGLTDIFYTRRGNWHILYGGRRSWTHVNDSDKPISGLLFGDFDDVRGTDVVGINGRGWDFSSGAILGWAPLNGKRSQSFDNAVAADVDGSVKSDIVFGGKGNSWRYSVDGRSALKPLRAGSGDVTRFRVGRFDGGPRQGIVNFGYGPHGDRLGRWRSLGGGHGRIDHSGQNMR